MLSVGIVGGTGYTGVELLRILAAHPKIEIKVATSRSEVGKKISSVYPSLFSGLLSNLDIQFCEPNLAELKKCDCVFFAAPNGTAMQMVPELLKANVKVIDLAADFRIKNSSVWEHWYKQPHACPDILQTAVYGLPELHREEIKKAQLIANPGCYPTAVILGYLPLLEAGVAKDVQLIADTKSGVSGAGRVASVPTLFSEVGENFRAYNVNAHRHWPEIKQELEAVVAHEVKLVFTPHLVPMVRGIFATLYVTNSKSTNDLTALYQHRYKDEPFVQVLEEGVLPETKHVRASNQCMLSVSKPYNGDTVVVLSVIDNLVKGAAGQAVQNMNLMFGIEETTGLLQPGLFP
jgi:N-acetyl-gamma-glutamyl-phosphate reductase